MTKMYTREFKIEAVHLTETSDKTYAEVAAELGVSKSVLKDEISIHQETSATI